MNGIFHKLGPQKVIETLPFARFLNVSLKLCGDELTMTLPYRPELIGNPIIPALHGGVIGAFMEMTAMAQLAYKENFDHFPKPINSTVQYLRTGKAQDTFARARLNRVGRTIANIEVAAWQDEINAPIANLHAHFLLQP
jgi:acyl-coenzyme A thioesterase PaaI-like protein